MGLDQYLSASKYVSDSEFRDDGTREAFSAVLAAVNGDGFVGGMVPSATITLSVGYWRKANQVHGWFVNNLIESGQEDGTVTIDNVMDYVEELAREDFSCGWGHEHQGDLIFQIEGEDLT